LTSKEETVSYSSHGRAEIIVACSFPLNQFNENPW